MFSPENRCKGSNDPNCRELLNNINQCNQAAMGGKAEYQCIEKARQRYGRKTGFMKDMVYPWKNFDWDYTRFIDNNYSTFQTGIKKDANIPQIFKNIDGMIKLGKGFALDPNPSPSSRANSDDIANCDIVAALETDPRNKERARKKCQAINNIKKQYDWQQKPYDDPFFDKKLDGENSSSFFYQYGHCKTLHDEKTCKDKKYKWIGGFCYKPKYHYIENKPGIDFKKVVGDTMGDISNKITGDFKGNIPSAIGDMLSINPINLVHMVGDGEGSDFQSMKCGIENFTDGSCSYKSDVDSIWGSVIAFFILLFVILVFCVMYWGMPAFLL